MDSGTMGVPVEQRRGAAGPHRGFDAPGIHICDGVGDRGGMGLAAGACRARERAALGNG
jgi:hypothetical protein